MHTPAHPLGNPWLPHRLTIRGVYSQWRAGQGGVCFELLKLSFLAQFLSFNRFSEFFQAFNASLDFFLQLFGSLLAQ